MLKKKAASVLLCLSVLVSSLVSVGTFPETRADAATIVKIGDSTAQAEDGNVLTFECGGQEVKLELCTDRTVRVQLSLNGSDGYRPPDPQYYMVQKDDWDPVERTVTDRGDYIEIETDQLDLHVQKSPFRIAMYDLDGNLLSKDADDQGLYWDETGIRGDKKVEGTQNAGGIFGFGSGDHGRREELNRYDTDFSEFTMSHGRLIAPFFMSTVGYGIFLNTIETNTTFFKHGGGFQTQGYLDYYFMYGPDFKTILNEYEEITGRMELYGKWAQGFMLSKYGSDNATQAEFLQWLNTLRDDGFPSDVYVFDYGWRGDVADNGGSQTGAGQKFGKLMWSNDTAKFPDVPAMLQQAAQMGFHVGLHVNAGTPEASGGNQLYQPDKEKKWVDAIMDNVVKPGLGDFFWPDEFDVLGSNTAPTLSAKGAYEAWEDYTDESRPMFMTRGSYAGQHFATAWSGDISNTSAELGNQIGFSIDAGLVGYWETSHDLGGFLARPSDQLYTRWVSEFGAWNGLMRTHGHNGREPWTYSSTAQDVLKQNLKIRYSLYPYLYSSAWQGYSQGTPIMRAMLLEDGSQYNPDAWNLNKQYYFGDWFLVAPAQDTADTKVAVWLPPETTWYNYYTGKRYEAGPDGRTMYVDAPLEDIPVFVKSGAIVPMGPDVDYADEKPLDPLTIDIYPKGTTDYTLYEDDGVSRKYITENAYSTTRFESVQNGNDISFHISARDVPNPDAYQPDPRSYNLKFNHIAQISGVTVNAAPIQAVSTEEEYDAAQQAYWADTANHIVYVKTPDTGEEINVALDSGGIVEPELGEEEEPSTGTPISDGDRFELEDATMTGQVSKNAEWKGYTGTGFAKGFQAVGDAVQFDADIQQAGLYNLVIRVNNGKKNNPTYDSTPRTGGLYLNGAKVADLSFAVTDTWGDSNKNGVWVNYTIPNVSLSAGTNTIKIQAEGSNPGNFNLDSITFNRVNVSVDAFSRIEAESSPLHTGMTQGSDAGDTYLAASADGVWAQYNNVNGADKGGLRIRVKSSTGGKITAFENGVGDKVLATFDVPGDGQWNTLEALSADTDAEESNIFFEFTADSGSSLDCDFDWFQFIRGVKPGGTYEAENSTGDTSSATGDGSGTVRVDTQWPGYTGSGYVAGWKAVGNYIQFTAGVSQPGTYDLVLHVGNGKKNSPAFDSTPRTGALYVDDEKVADFALDVHETWGEWFNYTIEGVPLEQGIHTFKFRSEGSSNSGNFNLDSITFDLQTPETHNVTVTPLEGATVTADPAQAAPGDTVTVSISGIDPGKEFRSITVTDADETEIDTTEVTPGQEYTFLMPDSDATVTVELQDVTPETLNIRSVQDFDPLSVPLGTEFSDLELPEAAEVTLSDDSTAEQPVVWDEGDYDGTEAGTYTLTGSLTLEDGITNTDGVQASIQIVVQEEGEPTVTGVFVTPDHVSVRQGETYQFTSEVSGTNDPSQEVTWSLEGAEADSSIDDGLLTVAEDETAETLTVLATSAEDPSQHGTATVTVLPAQSGEPRTVESFSPLSSSQKNRRVPKGTSLSALNLPERLKAVVDGEENVWVDVTEWVSEVPYQPNVTGVYHFSPVLASGFVLDEGVELPEITVTVRNTSSGGNSSSGNPPVETGPRSTATTTYTNGGTVVTVTSVPDSAPSVSGDRSEIVVTVPPAAATAAGSATAENPAQIAIGVPQDTVLAQLSGGAVNSVGLTLRLPAAVAENSNSNVSLSVVVPQQVLQAAKDAQRDLVVSVVNADTGRALYSWNFSGAGLRNSVSSITDVNLSLAVLPVQTDAAASAVVARSAAPGDTDGILIRFAHTGLLPEPADVRIYVGDQPNCTPGSRVYLYYLNEEVGALEQMPAGEYTVDPEGFVEFHPVHCSDYVLLPSSAANPYPVRSDTTYPVGISAGRQYTFAVTVSGGQTPAFAVGDGKSFSCKISRQGDKYYVTVTAVGSAGAMSALYSTLPGQKPVRLCYIAVVK